MKAAIYARYSSELQNEKSIEDQVALCRGYAERNGLDVVTVYSDRARSGASMIGRDGVMQLMFAAKDRAFDVVLVEALDRLSRDQEDLAGMWKRLNFSGVVVHTVHGGKVDSIQVGFGGIIGQYYLQDLAKKVHRGLSGVVRDGRHAGGRAYGYRPVPGQPGQLVIVEDEAAIVREIFAAYVGGKTPREIASSLNGRNVPAPRGEDWTASAINGSRERQNGILMNRLYAGTLVWNRLRMVKDPDTGKRVSRLNPKEEWQIEEVPHLRIVDQETFDAAQARKAEVGGSRPHMVRRAKRVLSGLLKCGCCGAGMSVKDTTKGVVRVQCSRMKETGKCNNRAAYDLTLIETTVFDGLRRNLDNPAAIAAFVEEYNAERKRLAADLTARRNSIERRLAQARREIDRVVDAVAKGMLEDSEVMARMPPLRAERNLLEAELANADVPHNVVTLHPATVLRYREQVENLARALNDHIVEGDPEPANALRSLVSAIVVYPKKDDGTLEVEIKGKLAALIGADAFPNGRVALAANRHPRLGGMVVAEEGAAAYARRRPVLLGFKRRTVDHCVPPEWCHVII